MRLPDSINKGFSVDLKKMHALLLPVESMSIEELKHNLDIPYLEKEGTDDRNLTPRMLVCDFDKEIHHASVVKNADIQYPIDIYLHLGKWIILDGVHRFTKLFMQGATHIRVRKIPYALIASIQKTNNV